MSHTIEWPSTAASFKDTTIIESPPDVFLHYIQCDAFGEELRSLEWLFAKSSINGRFLMPMFEVPLEEFIEFLKTDELACLTTSYLPGFHVPEMPTPVGRLHLVVHSAYIHEGQRGLHIGGVILPEPESTPIDVRLIAHELRNYPDYLPLGNLQAQARQARARSLALLMEHLTPEQQQDLMINRWFSVRGSNGKTYIITMVTHGNVWLVDANRLPLANYCIVTPDVPIFDQMLAQKLLIQAKVEDMEAIANKTVNPGWTPNIFNSDREAPLQEAHITLTMEDFQEGRLREIQTQIDARRTA